MQLGICTGAGNDPVLSTTGLDFIEENVQNLLVPGADEAGFAALVKWVFIQP